MNHRFSLPGKGLKTIRPQLGGFVAKAYIPISLNRRVIAGMVVGR